MTPEQRSALLKFLIENCDDCREQAIRELSTTYLDTTLAHLAERGFEVVPPPSGDSTT